MEIAISSKMDPIIPRAKNGIDGRSAQESALIKIPSTIIQKEILARRGFHRETNLNLGKA
jgi:hypothetical protein